MGAYWREPGSKGDGKSTGYWKREGGKQDSQGARKNRTNLATILNIFRAKKRQIGATNKEMWEPGVKELELPPSPHPTPLSLETVESRAKYHVCSSLTWLTFQLQTANVILTERGSQLNIVQRDTEHQKSQFERLQEKIRLEKVSDNVTSCPMVWSRYRIQLVT